MPMFHHPSSAAAVIRQPYSPNPVGLSHRGSRKMRSPMPSPPIKMIGMAWAKLWQSNSYCLAKRNNYSTTRTKRTETLL